MKIQRDTLLRDIRGRFKWGRRGAWGAYRRTYFIRQMNRFLPLGKSVCNLIDDAGVEEISSRTTIVALECISRGQLGCCGEDQKYTLSRSVARFFRDVAKFKHKPESNHRSHKNLKEKIIPRFIEQANKGS